MTQIAHRQDGTALIELDPWLKPFDSKLRDRYAYYRKTVAKFDSTGGLLGQVSQGHQYFGFNRGELWGKPGVWYREWAPAALQLRLIGDFNNWDRFGHPLVSRSVRRLEPLSADDKFADKLVARQQGEGSRRHRKSGRDGSHPGVHPPRRRRIRSSPTHSSGNTGIRRRRLHWKHRNPPRGGGLADLRSARRHGAGRGQGRHVRRVHGERPAAHREAWATTRSSSWRSGASVLRIVRLSREQFLRRVSSRFGTPEELKQLIDTAHGLGLRVSDGSGAQPCGEEHATRG